MSKISESWDGILKWLATHAPKTLETFNPGASLAAIYDVEQALGIQFPHSVREFYLICNGQHGLNYPVLPNYYSLLPLDEIKVQWEFNVGLLREMPDLADEIPERWFEN